MARLGGGRCEMRVPTVELNINSYRSQLDYLSNGSQLSAPVDCRGYVKLSTKFEKRKDISKHRVWTFFLGNNVLWYIARA